MPCVTRSTTTTGEDNGGDAVLIKDSSSDNASEFFIHHNIFEADRKTQGGVIMENGMPEKAWIYNNTFVGLKDAAISGGNSTFVFNNAIADCMRGIQNCAGNGRVEYNAIETSQSALSSVNNGGNNYVGQDPQIDKGNYEPKSGSFSIDAGTASFTGGGITINLSYNGNAPDLGAVESNRTQPPPPPPGGNGDSAITAQEATAITASSATANFDVADPDGDNPRVKIFWGTSDGGTAAADRQCRSRIPEQHP